MRSVQEKTIGMAWLSRSVIREMCYEADCAYPRETGGVLIGYWSKPYTEVVITEMIGPGPCALHKRSCFSPDASYQDLEIARVYHESGRLHTYLGDWHTHPDASPYLSRIDRQTLRRISDYTPARAPVPLMGVLGFGTPWSFQVWGYVPSNFLRFQKSRFESFKVLIF